MGGTAGELTSTVERQSAPDLASCVLDPLLVNFITSLRLFTAGVRWCSVTATSIPVLWQEERIATSEEAGVRSNRQLTLEREKKNIGREACEVYPGEIRCKVLAFETVDRREVERGTVVYVEQRVSENSKRSLF